MKKYILLLLLATFSIQAQTLQNPTFGTVKIKNNIASATATKVNVQEADGVVNTIAKNDLIDVVEVNDVPSLPLIGNAGKIYVVKNVNKIYRWNGTFYQELAGSDISGLQAQIDLKANDSEVVKLTGNQTISGQKSFSLTGKIDMQTNNAFPGISVTTLGSNGQSAAAFINSSSFPNSTALRLQTGSSGGVGNMALRVSNQSSIGTGIFSDASNGGVSISSQSGDGDSYISNITFGGTGRNYVGRNNGTETYSVDKTGNVIGNSYIKRSTPANNILLAGGGDISQASLPISTATQTVLDLKANLVSPALTDTPTAPTATAGTNTTQIATTAFVTGAISTADSGNVKLTGTQTVTGQKTFSAESTFFKGIVLNPYTTTFTPQNGGSLAVINNKLNIVVGNSNNQYNVARLNFDNAGGASTNNDYLFQNVSGTVALTNNPTPLTATSFIKSSSPATNILLAGGGDIAQNTAFNKNFGTTAGTVGEGNDSRILNGQTAFGWGNHVNGGYAFTTGSNINQADFRTALGLGSNAYNSTAYLPTSSNIAGTLGAINVYGTSGVNSYLGVINMRNGVGAKEWRLSTGIENYTQEGFGIKNVTDNNHPIWILNGGNIGIGTTTPTAKLDVNGTFKATGAATFSSTVTATSYTATSLPVFENNAAASSLSVGQFYRTSIGVLMVKF